MRRLMVNVSWNCSVVVEKVVCLVWGTDILWEELNEIRENSTWYLVYIWACFNGPTGNNLNIICRSTWKAILIAINLTHMHRVIQHEVNYWVWVRCGVDSRIFLSRLSWAVPQQIAWLWGSVVLKSRINMWCEKEYTEDVVFKTCDATNRSDKVLCW